MKFIAVVLVALAISAQADESEYANYQTHYDHQPDPYAGYQNDLTSAYTAVTEKQDDLDMDVILPIVVFGGLGLGALAYVDSLNRMNNLCNRLRDITRVARGNVADGNTAVNLIDGTAAVPATNVAGEAVLNAAINSNRLFINALAAINDLDC